LHRVLVPPRGLFASGKFDQLQSEIPYATMAQAFQSLIRPLLGRSELELSKWRADFLQALGPEGSLILNLVPELKFVIGEQPAPPDMPPADAEARFQAVFRQFIGVFAKPEHPLALFLDDLQLCAGGRGHPYTSRLRGHRAACEGSLYGRTRRKRSRSHG